MEQIHLHVFSLRPWCKGIWTVLLLEQVMVPLGPEKQKMCSSLVRFAARHTLRSSGGKVQVEFLEVSIQLADDGMMPEPEFGEPDY